MQIRALSHLHTIKSKVCLAISLADLQSQLVSTVKDCDLLQIAFGAGKYYFCYISWLCMNEKKKLTSAFYSLNGSVTFAHAPGYTCAWQDGKHTQSGYTMHVTFFLSRQNVQKCILPTAHHDNSGSGCRE